MTRQRTAYGGTRDPIKRLAQTLSDRKSGGGNGCSKSLG